MVSFWNPKSHSKTSMRSENEIQYEDWEWDWEKQTAALLFYFFLTLLAAVLLWSIFPRKTASSTSSTIQGTCDCCYVRSCLFLHVPEGGSYREGNPWGNSLTISHLKCWRQYKQYCKFYFQVTSKSTLTSMQHTTPPSPSKETWPSPTDHYLSHTPPTAIRHPSHVS